MQAVAWCIQHLTESSSEARDTVRENGTLPLLVGILKSSAEPSARERAAWAICNTATKNAENKAAFRSAALPSQKLAWLVRRNTQLAVSDSCMAHAGSRS